MRMRGEWLMVLNMEGAKNRIPWLWIVTYGYGFLSWSLIWMNILMCNHVPFVQCIPQMLNPTLSLPPAGKKKGNWKRAEMATEDFWAVAKWYLELHLIFCICIWILSLSDHVHQARSCSLSFWLLEATTNSIASVIIHMVPIYFIKVFAQVVYGIQWILKHL